MDSSITDIMKATAPVLKEHGLAITKRLYIRMLEHHPDVIKNFFNISHINGQNGEPSTQAKALANAVFAYASYCDDLGALTDAVAVICNKHVSFSVPPEYYDLYGVQLIESIRDVLGEAASDEILNAWLEGYNFLADLFIKTELAMRKENLRKKGIILLGNRLLQINGFLLVGGWIGFKRFKVTAKVQETASVSSFYLKPLDGSPVPNFLPGQYLSLNFRAGLIPDTDNDTKRNYSLSCAPGRDYLRITVKRDAVSGAPPGVVSSYLHDHINTGSELEVGMPGGAFVLKQNERPVVLICGGIGLTPMISILETMIDNDDPREIVFIHCVHNADEHTFAKHVDNLLVSHLNAEGHAFYSRPNERDLGLTNMVVHQGKITTEALDQILPGNATESEFYYCGPKDFQDHVQNILKDLHVPSEQTCYEHFGPQLQ